MSSSINTNSLLVTVPKLNRKNFHHWKFAISMVLRRADCWDIVRGEEKKPSTRDGAEKWDAKANEGLTAIGLTVDSDQYQYIQDATNGPEAWKALSKIYEKNSRANRVALKRQFYGFSHDDTKPIQEYISGILELATRLKSIGVKLEDNDIMDVLLFNLDNSWSNIAASLCATVDDLGTVSDITGALLDEEGRRGGPDSDQTENSAFHVESRQKACSNCQKSGHLTKDCWAKGGQGKKKCFKCQKEGHLSFNCPESTDSANHAIDSDPTSNIAY